MKYKNLQVSFLEKDGKFRLRIDDTDKKRKSYIRPVIVAFAQKIVQEKNL